jgi:hypothetical protein
MKVRLHIDRLVLDGLDVPHGARAALRVALERELGERIALGGLAPAFAAGTAIPSLEAPQMQTARNPAQLGTAIAQAVYGGIGGERRR